MRFCIIIAFVCAGCSSSSVSRAVARPATENPAPVLINTALSTRVDGNAGISAIGLFIENARDPETQVFEATRPIRDQIVGTYAYGDGIMTVTNGDFAVQGGTSPTAFMGRDLSGYEYAGVLNQALAPDLLDAGNDDRRIDARIIFGIPTAAEDMPAFGTVQMTGDAVLTYQDNDANVALRSDATIDADMNRNKVRVTIRPEADTPDLPFDTFERRNMVLRGSIFRGGYAHFTLNNKRVYPLVTGANSFARGQFFGADDDGPAEVGGMISVEADNARVSADFLAR